MLTHVEFRSDKFSPCEGEEKQTNPGVWGRSLAEFLRNGLQVEGFRIEEPKVEDWGWMLPVANEDFQLWVGCGHYQEYPDGFLCFIEPHQPSIRKFLKHIDTRERVSALQTAVNKVLAQESGIRGIRWWTYEEFNRSSGQCH